MDYGKKDAVRVSNVLGCAALFSILFGFVLLLAEKKSAWSETEYLIAFKIVSLAVFILPVVWGVRKLRRMEIGVPVTLPKAGLNKSLSVMLSTFGMIVIIRILYASVFPSAVETFGVNAEMSATEPFFAVCLFHGYDCGGGRTVFQRIFSASYAHIP